LLRVGEQTRGPAAEREALCLLCVFVCVCVALHGECVGEADDAAARSFSPPETAAAADGRLPSPPPTPLLPLPPPVPSPASTHTHTHISANMQALRTSSAVSRCSAVRPAAVRCETTMPGAPRGREERVRGGRPSPRARAPWNPAVSRAPTAPGTRCGSTPASFLALAGAHRRLGGAARRSSPTRRSSLNFSPLPLLHTPSPATHNTAAAHVARRAGRRQAQDAQGERALRRFLLAAAARALSPSPAALCAAAPRPGSAAARSRPLPPPPPKKTPPVKKTHQPKQPTNHSPPPSASRSRAAAS
jgi:hypothetical protein